jgi:hypothetical protein
MISESEAARLWSKVGMPDAATGCMEWLGRLGADGYGRCKLGRAEVRTRGDGGQECRAHRAVYRALVGEIPAGLVIDHLCRNPRCVRPDHMEAVTHRVNILRGEGPSARQARQTTCLQGHPFDEANTYVTKTGKRWCRMCDRDRHRRYRLEKGDA